MESYGGVRGGNRNMCCNDPDVDVMSLKVQYGFQSHLTSKFS